MSITPGSKFGGWTVVADAGESKVLCQCVCGTEREIRRYDLVNAKTLMCKSCAASSSKTSHGAAPYGKASPEYNTWVHMIQRCHNPNNKDYAKYGGRGITVWEPWRTSFEAFLLMVGKRPNITDTIERIDFNKGYEPGNVRWASRAEQTRNKSDNVKITLLGRTLTVTEWSRSDICSVSEFTIYKRLKRGWGEEESIRAPNGYKKGQWAAEATTVEVKDEEDNE